jgi:hypothetical protein
VDEAIDHIQDHALEAIGPGKVLAQVRRERHYAACRPTQVAQAKRRSPPLRSYPTAGQQHEPSLGSIPLFYQFDCLWLMTRCRLQA